VKRFAAEDVPRAERRVAAMIKAMERGWCAENCSTVEEIVLCNIKACQSEEEGYLLGYWASMIGTQNHLPLGFGNDREI
jgi:hypothetical protein